MLLAGKLINGFALGWYSQGVDRAPLLNRRYPGMFVSCAGGYCAEVSPLALRGVTTAAVNLWIDREYMKLVRVCGYARPNSLL